MGAPIPEMVPVDNSSAEALLSSLEGMAAAERRKHASIFNYWLSIRGDRQFPPIRDLDPLEISDAGPWSVLLEIIGAGENAVIRHLGQAIKLGVDAETIARAPNPSLLACIHARLPTVAATMQPIAFDDSFETDRGTARCWVTLLPFSASGSWIDYVYGFVSLDTGGSKAAEAPPPAEERESFQVPLAPLDEDAQSLQVEEVPAIDAASVAAEAESGPGPELAAESEPDIRPDVLDLHAGSEDASEPEPELVDDAALVPEPEPEPREEPEALLESDALREPEPEAALEPEPELEPLPELEASDPPARAGFSSKFIESVSGFYGRVVHAVPGEPGQEPVSDLAGDPVEEFATEEAGDPGEEFVAEDVCETVEAPVADDFAEEVTEPTYRAEGTLQTKLTEVRAMAEEAREAQLRSQLALYAGLSAAYDFALDAEGEPEEYLRLVEGQGLKIQLRAPMKPVVKLAFAETCDDATIAQLEAVLAWALKQDLPRGSLADRIEAEGGIGPILEGLGKAA
jgi:hypothetical protein